jgi:hypothetical protein
VVAIVSNRRREDAEHGDQNAHWTEFLSRWLARVGRHYDPKGFDAAGRAYVGWMNIVGDERFEFEFRQPLEQYIALQHSTATFARAKMGHELADQFDADLQETLRPFASDGFLRFRIVSSLVWGTPKATGENS